jgi:shikimate 5-dehydrogenase
MSNPNAFALAGLIGYPVAQSRSPPIHNFWLQRDHAAQAGGDAVP